MSEIITINSNRSLVAAFNKLTELFEELRYFQVTINAGKVRSLLLNSVFHIWCKQVSDTEKEYTAGQVKRFCKYYFGLPIMRGDDIEYNEKCAMVIDVLPYEHRIEAMELWPCTSLMINKQMLLFMQEVQDHYAGRVDLKFPPPKKY